MKYTLNEKKYMRFQNIFLCVFLCGFLLSGFHNGTWQEVLAAAVPEGKITRETKTMPEETIMKEEPEDSGEDISGVFQLTAGETEITVYTYGEEIYTVQGMMDVIEPEDGVGEYFLEISGPIEKEEMVSDETKSMIENMHPDEFGDASVSLTVYDGEKMYGFYGKARMTKETKGSAQNIEIMGHKEGFYDGVEIYS